MEAGDRGRKGQGEAGVSRVLHSLKDVAWTEVPLEGRVLSLGKSEIHQ